MIFIGVHVDVTARGKNGFRVWRNRISGNVSKTLGIDDNSEIDRLVRNEEKIPMVMVIIMAVVMVISRVSRSRDH